MKLVISYLVVGLCIFFASKLHAQELVQEVEKFDNPPQSSNFAIGFTLEAMQTDFAMSLDLTTPYFFSEKMAVRLRGGIAWAQGVPDGETEEDWLLFCPIRLGFVGSWSFAADTIRLYSEAGSILVLKIQDMASDTLVGIGGYGLFGFEFFSGPHVPVTYFIEAGAMGSSASANLMATDPSIANGFFVAAGLRWYL